MNYRDRKTLQTLSSVANDRFGHFRTVRLLDNAFQGPDAMFRIALQATNHLALGGSSSMSALAADRRFIPCLSKAMGEGMERYSLAFVDERKILRNRSHHQIALEQKVIDPELWNLYLPWQYQQRTFPWVRYTREQPLNWYRAWNHTERSTVVVPMSLVVHSSTDSWKLTAATTSGCAAHSSQEAAWLSAAYELIERDGFLAYWRTRSAPRLIDWDTIDSSEILRIASCFGDFKRRVRLYWLRTEFDLPLIVATYRGNSTPPGNPAFVVAAACHHDREQSCAKALYELCLSATYGFETLARGNPRNFHDPDAELRDFHHHIEYYLDFRNLHATRFLDQASLISFRSLPDHAFENDSNAWDWLVARARSLDFSLLTADLTPPDVAALGIRVYRALIPGLLEIEASHFHRRLSSRRLLEFPRFLDPKAQILSVDQINQDPHPFP